MSLTVADVVHVLGVDRDLVKTWSYRFKEHLTADANPPKGTPRQFSPADLKVLAYVSAHWGDSPDVDGIKSALGRGDHQDSRYDVNPKASSMRDAFTIAVENIARHGDTDIFPYPPENHLFFDRKSDVVDLLLSIHDSFDEFLTTCPPVNENTLAPTGYVGFRWATQIDSLWNAYLLGLVISIGPKVEAARLPPTERTVFSYRYSPSTTDFSLFDRSSSWSQFQERSLELAQKHKYVLSCDISDFYGRIYHHRLENALRWAGVDKDLLKQLMKLLQVFGDTKSYGLPVGGPAARLLSELLLNTTDRLLQNRSVAFCRFADDYYLFANSVEEAHRHLVFLSMKLLQNEGLSLQKSKSV